MTTAHPPQPTIRELRDVIAEAMSINWSDVMPDRQAGLLRAEYESSEQDPISWLKVWSSTKWGYWNLVCEYWMHEHPFGETGLRFGAGYGSAALGKSLDSILQHQLMFAPPLDGQSHGLIQVFPPDSNDNLNRRN